MIKKPAKSSDVRTNLGDYLRHVHATQEPFDFFHNSRKSFTLTPHRPESRWEPLSLKLEDCRENWNFVLEELSVAGGCVKFFRNFRLTDENGETYTEKGKVYLVPLLRNPISQRRRELRTQQRAVEAATMPTTADLAEQQGDLLEAQRRTRQDLCEMAKKVEAILSEMDTLAKQVRHTFAFVFRDGDLYATPEMGTVPLAHALTISNMDDDE